MIDIHAHVDDDGEWEKTLAAGVGRVILAGDDLTNSMRHSETVKRRDGCYFTVGIHPENAGFVLTKEAEEEFLSLCREEKCVAVGEIGLDYHYEGIDKGAQRELFVSQLLLANRACLPVQIHSRDACADTLAILCEIRPMYGFCMHCYSYGAENLDAFLSLGGYFSFGGTVCFKNARRNVESAEKCPLDRILTETDSPYLSPFRGEVNSPANIPVIVEKLAGIKNISKEELVAAVEKNAETLFFKLR